MEALLVAAAVPGAGAAFACSESLSVEQGLSAATAVLLLRLLEALEGDGAGDDGREAPACVAARLLELDVPLALLRGLPLLGFEARKSAARVLGALLRLAARSGPCGDDVIAYVRARRELLDVLLDGCTNREVFFHYAQVLQGCAGCRAVASELLSAGAVPRLLEIAQHQCFDIACEAFATLRALLVGQKEAAAEYLLAEFDIALPQYHACLKKDDVYTLQRQALSLLGELLMDPMFGQVMLRYVADESFLQIHMNLLRNQSNAVQLDAFHMFKLFVANPDRPLRVGRILSKNRDRLVRLLETFPAKNKDDGHFQQDLQAVLGILGDL